MEAFDLKRMLLDEFPPLFLGEVALRASFAYLAVFAFLKISGRRGVRQLSLFEVVVILTRAPRRATCPFTTMYPCCRS